MTDKTDPVHPGLISPLLFPLTDAEVAAFRERWSRAAARNRVRWIGPDGRARRRPPLPWPVRARLRAARTVDSLGAWLCRHGHGNAALSLWKALRMVRD